VVHPDGTSELLPLTDGVALGLLPDLEYLEHTVTLSPGDTVVLYTDGVTEAMDSQYNEFGNERLLEIFSERPPEGCKEANETIFRAVGDFAGETPQSDDITCLALRRGGSET
jgi:sigma-B regulation protein RsbU (phosphoserine phosphatase)